MRRSWKKRKQSAEIAPDEIFIDSSNLPEFDTEQFEGRIERPIKQQALWLTAAIVIGLFVLYGGRAVNLMFFNGDAYAKQASENQLSEQSVFADRGVVTDRAGRELAFNVRTATTTDFVQRTYATFRGLSHIIGYVKPPAKDSSGVYYRSAFTGIEGIEKVFDGILSGENGRVLTETDAHGKIVSQSVVQPPRDGSKVALSVDAVVTQALYDAIAQRAEESKFQGGAGVLIDVQTGEIVAMTSYPEYSSQALSSGDAASLAKLNADTHQPFLDRAVDGLYAPGSIVKPFMGVAALTEGVIDPLKKILSTGSISLPNPYDPEHPSIFKDWRPQGWVDLRHAIAVSSDVYFYEVGGGYQDQKGLGITLIDKYLRIFGFGNDAGLTGFSDKTGTIPTPEWKAATFDGDAWRIGDTYHTAIGQYGVQVTPLQAARAAASLANDGTLLLPTLLASSTPVGVSLPVLKSALQVVREGMRLGVTEGIAGSVNLPFVDVAAKTGTAQVGAHNEYINSWMIGFFPYEHPRYAYAVVLEKAPAGTAVGSPAAMHEFLTWLNANAPEYLQ